MYPGGSVSPPYADRLVIVFVVKSPPTYGAGSPLRMPDDRVQRGGAFLHEPEAPRSVVRNNWGAGDWANGVGFRIARTF